MDFEHACPFCGSVRASATPVMLSPACGHCGCAMDAVAVPSAQAPRPRAFVMPAVLAAAARPLCVLLAVLMLYATAKVGWDAGGPSGGMIAFGFGGFLLLPFVPQRVR